MWINLVLEKWWLNSEYMMIWTVQEKYLIVTFPGPHLPQKLHQNVYITDCRKLNTLGKNKHSFSQISENNFPWLWFCRIYFVLVGILKGNCRGYSSTTPINFTTKCHWWVQSSFVLKGICDTGFSYSMKPLPTALMSWLLYWVFRRKGKKRGFQVWSWKHADLLQLATC